MHRSRRGGRGRYLALSDLLEFHPWQLRRQDRRIPAKKLDGSVYTDPIMEKFAEVTQESIFGSLWTRPGLDLKTRALICVISDAATGWVNGRNSGDYGDAGTGRGRDLDHR